MRFKRADLPGLAFAGLASVGMYLLAVAAFGLWHHEGTPLLSILAMTFAVGAGVCSTFVRFVRHWRLLTGLIIAVGVDVAGVLIVQRTGHDWTVLAALLKLGGATLFLAANAVIAFDVIDWGLLPILDRRAARRAARA